MFTEYVNVIAYRVWLLKKYIQSTYRYGLICYGA